MSFEEVRYVTAQADELEEAAFPSVSGPGRHYVRSGPQRLSPGLLPSSYVAIRTSPIDH